MGEREQGEGVEEVGGESGKRVSERSGPRATGEPAGGESEEVPDEGVDETPRRGVFGGGEGEDERRESRRGVARS